MGALTSKPYSFSSRPWELRDRFSFDYTDPLFPPLKLSFRGDQLMRVLPNPLETVYDDWISDRARFSYDSYSSRLQPRNFVFNFSKERIFTSYMYLTNFYALRFSTPYNLADAYFDLNRENIQTEASGYGIDAFSSLNDSRSTFVFSWSDFYQALVRARSYVLIGLCLRYRSPILSARLRQIVKGFSGFVFGPYQTIYANELVLGSSVSVILKVCSFKDRFVRFMFKERPVFLFSSDLVRCIFNSAIFSYFKTYNLGYGASDILNSEFGVLSCLDAEVVYTSHFTDKAFFVMPTAHFYGLGKSPISSSAKFEGFSSSSFDEFITRPMFCKRFSNMYDYYSFNDYCLASPALKTSTNMLLNYKRNYDFRHNYFYFLRYSKVFGSYPAYTFGCGLYNVV